MDKLLLKGASVNKLGLGTYRLLGQEGRSVIQEAIKLGYTHIDSAKFYDNEEEVGLAMAQSGADREKLWLTTKIWFTDLSKEKFLPAVEDSLRKFKTDYVDLLLIHWPNHEIPLGETIDQLLEAQHKQYARFIGVSNFNSKLIKEATKLGADLLTNQVEYHPFLSQKTLLDTQSELNISLTAYRPIAKGTVNDNPVIKALAEKYGKSGVQITLRWLVQQPMVMAIPMTSKVHRLKENADVFDFQLTEEEMAAITELTLQNQRFVIPDWPVEWD